jgi:signal transduction histidine kinase
MEGWGWQSVHDPQTLPWIMDRWRFSIAAGRPFDTTLRLRGADGRFRRFLTRVTPVRDPKTAELLRWVGTNTDVEDREELLTLAAHELRTPLTSLQLRLQLMRRELDDRVTPATPQQLAASLDVALMQIARLGSVVTEVLDMSRTPPGTVRVERTEVDLGQLTAQVVKEHFWDVAAPQRSIEVAAGELVVVNGDRFHLEQMVANLLANAVKYGGDKPIRVSVAIVDESAQLRVEDQGIGISPENETRIFERFGRAVSSRNHSGLGLGLYIAREIAQAHGGTISVRSAMGIGSVFTALIPLSVCRSAL